MIEETQTESNGIVEIIRSELTKFDVVVPAVNDLAKQFLPLKIISADDKVGYSDVSKALRLIVSKRTAVEEKRKELKADSLAFGKAVDNRAREITAMLQPIEDHLKSQKIWFESELERINAEEQRIKAEEQERKNKIIDDRLDKLMGLNMYQTVTEFIWKSKLSEDSVSILRVNLELWSDEDFEAFRIELKSKVDAENEFIAEKDRILKAEAEKVEAEKKAIEDQKQALEKELEEMRNQRASLRYKALSDLGLGTMSFSPYWSFIFKYINPAVVNFVHNDDIMFLNSPEWNDLLECTKQKLEQLKSLEQKAADIEKERQADIEKEKQAVIIANELMLEKQRQEAAKAAEAEKLANMSDKDIYLEYIKRLKEVTYPVLKTKKWQGLLSTVTKSIDAFKNF
jgi:hypothetical protein